MGLAITLLKAPHVGIRDLKEHLSEFLKKEKPVIVTDHGLPTNVIVSYEEMVELLDIIDELQDKETQKIVAEGRMAIRQGEKGVLITDSFKNIRARRK